MLFGGFVLYGVKKRWFVGCFVFFWCIFMLCGYVSGWCEWVGVLGVFSGCWLFSVLLFW